VLLLQVPAVEEAGEEAAVGVTELDAVVELQERDAPHHARCEEELGVDTGGLAYSTVVSSLLSPALRAVP